MVLARVQEKISVPVSLSVKGILAGWYRGNIPYGTDPTFGRGPIWGSVGGGLQLCISCQFPGHTNLGTGDVHTPNFAWHPVPAVLSAFYLSQSERWITNHNVPRYLRTCNSLLAVIYLG
jgi:hypothetical protein